MDQVAQHHKQQAELSQLGEHWHQKLWYGDGPWDGDRFLNIYHHPLTDKIIVKYEVPNQKPETVFAIDLADFDIHKLCMALAKADNRKTSALEKLDEAENANARLEAAAARAAEEREAEAAEKVQWAIRKDTGSHIAPMTLPGKKW